MHDEIHNEREHFSMFPCTLHKSTRVFPAMQTFGHQLQSTGTNSISTNCESNSSYNQSDDCTQLEVICIGNEGDLHLYQHINGEEPPELPPRNIPMAKKKRGSYKMNKRGQRLLSVGSINTDTLEEKIKTKGSCKGKSRKDSYNKESVLSWPKSSSALQSTDLKPQKNLNHIISSANKMAYGINDDLESSYPYHKTNETKKEYLFTRQTETQAHGRPIYDNKQGNKEGEYTCMSANLERTEPDWEVSPKDIKLFHRIGAGSFGQVWKGSLKGKPVAVKLLNGKEKLNLINSSISLH